MHIFSYLADDAMVPGNIAHGVILPFGDFCTARSKTGIIRLKILTLNGEVIMETSCGTTLVPRLIESCKQPLRMVTGALE